MKKFLIMLILFFSACSTKTLYNIDIDLLSFLDEVELNHEIVFPASMQLSVYLFPEAEISSEGPGLTAQKGIVLSFPTKDNVDLESFSIRIEIEAEIKNNSLSDLITGDRISAYLAPVKAENIYIEGIRIDLINIDTILPLKSTIFTQELFLKEDEPLLEILKDGEFRLGMGIFLTSSAESVPAFYQLNRINLYTSFTAVDLLNLNE